MRKMENLIHARKLIIFQIESIEQRIHAQNSVKIKIGRAKPNLNKKTVRRLFRTFSKTVQP